MRRAIMSLPVPLSPSIRTGTFARAIFSNRPRTTCMWCEIPKITESGGRFESEILPGAAAVIPTLFCVLFRRALEPVQRFAPWTPKPCMHRKICAEGKELQRIQYLEGSLSTLLGRNFGLLLPGQVGKQVHFEEVAFPRRR